MVRDELQERLIRLRRGPYQLLEYLMVEIALVLAIRLQLYVLRLQQYRLLNRNGNFKLRDSRAFRHFRLDVSSDASPVVRRPSPPFFSKPI